jgi:hypothetical protein
LGIGVDYCFVWGAGVVVVGIPSGFVSMVGRGRNGDMYPIGGVSANPLFSLRVISNVADAIGTEAMESKRACENDTREAIVDHSQQCLKDIYNPLHLTHT